MVITMKKLRSLALALCLGLALPAAAADAAAVDAPSAVSVGSVTAAVRADGSLWVWDAEGEQQGGERDGIFVKLMDGVASVSCGSNASAAVKTDGTLWMWEGMSPWGTGRV